MFTKQRNPYNKTKGSWDFGRGDRVVLEEIMDRALQEETSDIHFLPLEKDGDFLYR